MYQPLRRLVSAQLISAFLIVTLPASGFAEDDDLEARRAECRSYAKFAVQQVKRYEDLKCTDKENSARWNRDEGAHFSWCFFLTESDAAEAEFGSRQEMVDKARNDREEFLAICKPATQTDAQNGASADDSDYHCEERIGDQQFRPEQIKKYLTREPNHGSFVCDYYFDRDQLGTNTGHGQVRVEGKWLSGESLSSDQAGSIGCDKKGGGVQMTRGFPGGAHINSPSHRAIAHMTGDTKAAADWARNNYLGPLQKMFIIAETRARQCD